MPGPTASPEQALVDLAQWIARAIQYSPRHPVVAGLASTAHASLRAALERKSPLDVGVTKDGLVVEGVPARHPALRSRLGPLLHERGVLLVRFGGDVRIDEVVALVDLLSLPPDQIFAHGGMRRALAERGVSRVQVEAVAHSLSADERSMAERDQRLRVTFHGVLSRVLGRRGVDDRSSAALLDLLEDPEVASHLLEEQENLAEAVAGMCLLVLQKEARSGVPLRQKMRAVLSRLVPNARMRVLYGWPSLAGDFREALTTMLSGMDDDALADFALPAIVLAPSHLTRALYTLRALAGVGARRGVIVRRLAARLHDLPLDEPSTLTTLQALSQRPDEPDPYEEEREVLALAAERASSAALLFDRPPDAAEPRLDSFAPGALDRLSQHDAVEIVLLAARMVDFESFCTQLPRAAEFLGEVGGTAAVAGIFRALRELSPTRWRNEVRSTLHALAQSGAAIDLIEDVERSAHTLEGERLEETIEVLRILAAERPEPLLELLSRTESRKVRRVLLDLLPDAGPALLPLVLARLRAPEWYIARNMVTLVRRAGGASSDLAEVATHAHPQVRLEVVRALRGVNDDGAHAILVRALADETHDVRSAALAALSDAALGAAAAYALAEVALDPQRDDDVKRRVVSVLGRCRDDAAPAALLHLLEPRGFIELPSTAALRDHVALSLYRCRAPAAAAAFQRGLHSSSWRVRKACERAAARGDDDG